MKNQQGLCEQLINLEGRSYKEYKGIKGHYAFSGFESAFELWVDYVQGDPFAAPSRIRLRVSQQVGGFPSRWLTDYAGQTAIADYLTRQVGQVAQSIRKKRGSGKSGHIDISAPSQAILRRSALFIGEDGLEARLTVGLPAFGRRIAGRAAAELLGEDIPLLVNRSLKYAAIDAEQLKQHVETFQDAEALRSQLADRKLIAFVAQGACLPRRSGVDERSLLTSADKFVPPAKDVVTLETPHSGQIKGLGIKEGVTLIVGGGYHGKSTLLKAIEQGIYNHIPGDGREQVVADARAVKLRAEDGRSVVGVDISPVINHLPRGQSSQNFSTANASGSTSQAAGLIEAIEAGAKVLLIDEDTAATNFMIRDRNMQALIAKDKEPITPFVDKVRQLYDDYGISTILVMGGSGDYFAIANTVIAMEDYQPRIVTQQAKAIVKADANQRAPEGGDRFGQRSWRAILPGSLPKPKDRKPLKVKAQKASLILGREEVDLRAIEQIVERQQVRAIAQAMRYAQKYYFDPQRTLGEVLDYVMEDIGQGGLDVLTTGLDERVSGELTEFRRFELAAAINRLRTIKVLPISV